MSTVWRAAAAALGALLALAAAAERPAPLLLNLGAGDEPFARGFRGGWERDGLGGAGHTMFRWTLDGARLVMPFEVDTPSLHARLRLARFTDTATDMTLLVGGRIADTWRQEPRGFSVHEADLGALRGSPVLQFRSPDAAGELGVALDWVELRGASRLRPSADLAWDLCATLVGIPLLVAIATRSAGAGLWLQALLAAVGAAGTLLDRFGGLLALGSVGIPGLVVAACVLLAHRVLARFWGDLVPRGPGPVVVPVALALLALLALSHPFFHYPDADLHARFLHEIRADPWLALDPREFQAETGAWTREIAGHRVAFPYSAAFHVAAWPLARWLGDLAAIETTAAIALGVSGLAVHALARSVGLGPAAAISAQVTLALLPVTVSRLTLALYPTLLGQALETLLLVHLGRRFGRLDGARDASVAVVFLLVPQLAYTGSLANVGAVVAMLAALELAAGEAARVRRLLSAWALAAALAVAALYLRLLPVLWNDVLPHAGTPSGDAPPGLLAALGRLTSFYGAWVLAAIAGVVVLRGTAPHPRRVLTAGLAAGLALLLGRALLPSLLRDAKEVELLAAPVAVASAAALAGLARRGWPGRIAATAFALWATAFGVSRAIEAYGPRVLAVGR